MTTRKHYIIHSAADRDEVFIAVTKGEPVDIAAVGPEGLDLLNGLLNAVGAAVSETPVDTPVPDMSKTRFPLIDIHVAFLNPQVAETTLFHHKGFMTELGVPLIPYSHNSKTFGLAIAGDTRFYSPDTVPSEWSDANRQPNFFTRLSDANIRRWEQWLLRRVRVYDDTADIRRAKTEEFLGAIRDIDPLADEGKHFLTRDGIDLMYDTAGGVPKATIEIDTDGFDAREVVELYKYIIKYKKVV